MNIKKLYRLNTREIKYITKTKNKFFLRWKILNINFIDQYTDKVFNKFGIWISAKFNKKAVIRNQLRRAFFDIIYKNNYVSKKINRKYKKVYVSLKKDIPEKDIEKLKTLLEKDLQKLFNFVYKKKWTSS